jgi:ribose 1,5-bisphosphokinase
LAREGAPVPEGVEAIVIDNSAALDDGIAAFVAALTSIADLNPGPDWRVA